jgi:hypothetical protein
MSVNSLALLSRAAGQQDHERGDDEDRGPEVSFHVRTSLTLAA